MSLLFELSSRSQVFRCCGTEDLWHPRHHDAWCGLHKNRSIRKRRHECGTSFRILRENAAVPLSFRGVSRPSRISEVSHTTISLTSLPYLRDNHFVASSAMFASTVSKI